MDERRLDDALLADHREGFPLAEIATRHGLDGPAAAREAVSAALRRLDARIDAGLAELAGRRQDDAKPG
jgi:hypothetical protein